jgi:4-hydroxy 2-oxovalerate aldolase
MIPRLPFIDRSAIVLGTEGSNPASCCTPNGPLSALRDPAHAILQRVGEAGYVGGQEDMIIDVALQLQREQDDVATGHYD